MTLEVRQLVIKSTVGEGSTLGGSGEDLDVDRLRESLLAECRSWFLDQQRQQKER
jgi:hypothetical protein